MEVLLDGGKMAYDGGQYWKGGDDGFAIRKNSEGTTPGQTKNQELTIFAEQSSRREDSFGSLPTVELTSTSTFAFFLLHTLVCLHPSLYVRIHIRLRMSAIVNFSKISLDRFFGVGMMDVERRTGIFYKWHDKEPVSDMVTFL